MDRMYAPWRLAFLKGQVEDPLPRPSGCIFCDYPLLPRAEVPARLVDKDGKELEVRHKTRRAWDRARYVITARERAFVILNKYPYGNGHVMVVPRTHTSKLEELDEEAFQALHALLKETVAAVREVYAPHGMNVGMNMGRAAGAGIDEHVHYHVLPRWNGDVNFMPALVDTKVINESLEDAWERLASVLRRPEDDGGT